MLLPLRIANLASSLVTSINNAYIYAYIEVRTCSCAAKFVWVRMRVCVVVVVVMKLLTNIALSHASPLKMRLLEFFFEFWLSAKLCGGARVVHTYICKYCIYAYSLVAVANSHDTLVALTMTVALRMRSAANGHNRTHTHTYEYIHTCIQLLTEILSIYIYVNVYMC